jgi:retron-type reverse transcriptase
MAKNSPNCSSPDFLETEEAQLECRKRKRSTMGFMYYNLNETENTYVLYTELNERTYEISPSDVFIVKKPVPREVFAGQYRDRVVHHLVMRRKMAEIEERFIPSSYSCRVGMGTKYGVDDAYEQLQRATDNFSKEVFIVKGDLTSCFMRVDKHILMNMLNEILCSDWERWIFGKIIYNRPQDYCILKSPVRDWLNFPPHKSLFGTDGMPIGNLTSQILVNFYLSMLDRWALAYPHILGYGRYVDDFFAIFGSREEAQQFLTEATDVLAPLNMALNFKKIRIYSSKFGFDFIGAYIKPHRIYVTHRTIKTFNEWCWKMHDKDITLWFAPLNSYLGYLSNFSCRRMRIRALEHWNFGDWGYFDENYTKFTPYKEHQQRVGCKKSKKSQYIRFMTPDYKRNLLYKLVPEAYYMSKNLDFNEK